MKRNKLHVAVGRIPRTPQFRVEDMGKLALYSTELNAAKFPAFKVLPLHTLRRFHVVTGLHPDFMPNTDETIVLVPSRHSVEEAQNEWAEKGVRVYLPTHLPMDKVSIIEQGVYNNRLDRLLVRVRHDSEWDLVLSILYRTKPGSPKGIITAWVNRTGDKHYTLGRGVYERPNK
jgi:hypothetical protein